MSLSSILRAIFGLGDTYYSVYTVKAGDTLSAIAKDYYDDGTTASYMKIFNANRDKLSDPDKITPGQVLRIPR